MTRTTTPPAPAPFATLTPVPTTADVRPTAPPLDATSPDLASLEAAPHRPGRAVPLVLGVVLLLLVALSATGPLLLDQRAFDQSLQEALLHAAQAEQQHLVEHGTYTGDTAALQAVATEEPGAPAGVAVEAHRGDDLTYCLSASADGTTLWLTELGEISTTPCV